MSQQHTITTIVDGLLQVVVHLWKFHVEKDVIWLQLLQNAGIIQESSWFSNSSWC